MSDDTYNGWTNRETWAVALHINNDQGWQESVLEAIRAKLEEVDSDDLTDNGRKYLAGDVIRENVESTLDPFGDSDDAEALTSRQAHMVREEIGSMWRVDWAELGEAFLDDLSDD